jgi:putative NADH-flavin reductase
VVLVGYQHCYLGKKLYFYLPLTMALNRIMKIAIFGSTGLVGNVLIKKAITAGYEVKTLARDPGKLENLRDRIEIIKGNVFEPLSIEATIQGTGAVLSTIGPPPGKKCDPLQYEKAMKDIVRLMDNNNIKRYIHIGGAAHAGGENEYWPFERRFLRLFLNLFGKQILVAKHLEWEVLKTSDLDWTLVRPPRIANEKVSGKISVNERKLDSLKVSVEDLADFILEQITSKEWIRKAPLISSLKK